MRLHIIADDQGNIVSIHSGRVSGTHAAISNAGVTPGPGHTLHTVDLGDEFRAIPLAELHRQFAVAAAEGTARLVRRSEKSD